MQNVHERRSYFGVTGYMAAREVEATLTTRLPESRDLMVGVLMSRSKLCGGMPRYVGRYPEPHEVKTIFVNHPRAINLIHYASNDKATLPDQIEQLIEIGGEHLKGFQFNMIWPDPQHLRSVAERMERIVLQLNGPAIKKAGRTPEAVAERLLAYEGCVSDVLFDLSGGNGKMLDIEHARRFLSYLVPKLPHFVFGAAGGLGPETIGIVKPLLKEFPALNIDAESWLRDASDALDIGRTNEYLAKAGTLVIS